MPVDKTLRVSMLLKTEDEIEAKIVLEDLLSTLKERLEYWGYGLETHSPYTLMGEVT